MILKSEKMSL